MVDINSNNIRLWSNRMLLNAAKARRTIIRNQKRIMTRIVWASRVKFVFGCRVTQVSSYAKLSQQNGMKSGSLPKKAGTLAVTVGKAPTRCTSTSALRTASERSG
jgi:hypothetical protein